MKYRLLPALVTVLLVGSAAFAQGQDGPPPFGGPGGPPPFGEGPGPGGPGGGRFGRQRALTAASIPVEALTHYLKLSSEQEQRVTDIVEELRDARPRPPMPPQGGGNGGQWQPPSREDMEAMRKKMDAAEAEANQSIRGLLNDNQKRKLPELIQAFSALRADRISLSATVKLNLSAAQIKRLAALGRTATHTAVVSDFTAKQKEVADLNRIQQGRRPPGGPPEGGPPDGGPPDGPPPGGDGQGPPPGGPPES